MATPEWVELVCPLSQKHFRARTMGSSYYISGIDTDLRELGSIEEVRRFSVVTSPFTGYTDYAWEFMAPEELEPTIRSDLEAALSEASPKAPNRVVGDFERLRLARTCFAARQLDVSALAELSLLSYYVAQDLGRRDLAPGLRDEAAGLFARALEEEELPGPLRQRYAFLAGELNRRSGRREDAMLLLNQSIEAGSISHDDEDPEGTAWDIERFARRMRAEIEYRDAPAEELLELTQGADAEVASEACRLLASRRDQAGVEAIQKVWAQVSGALRTDVLRELVIDPPEGAYDIFVEALQGPAPEAVRLGARGLGELGQARAAETLLAALEEGVLSTEATLIEALRRLEAPGTLERVASILEQWEARDREAGDDEWYFGSDTTPLRHMLYTSGGPKGLELLVRDMKQLEENDLWDKVPSGGPVSAALTLDGVATDVLLALLGDENPAARRWSSFCLGELGVRSASDALRGLMSDADVAVRLQAARSLARLGDTSGEQVVLTELKALDDGDLPFALHFLVPFKSAAVKSFLLELLESGKATRSEVLPLLGRQESEPELTAILTSGLLETDDDTRASAVTGLAYQGGDDVAERLRLLYDQEESEEVQRRVVFGLGSLARSGFHREQTVAFLRERLNKANPRLRFSMALTLLQLGDPTGIDLVRERAALFDESFDRYDLVAPALKALAAHEAAG